MSHLSFIFRKTILMCIPPSVPLVGAVPLAPACSGSACDCRGIGRSQWRCSSAEAEPNPDWELLQRARPHLNRKTEMLALILPLGLVLANAQKVVTCWFTGGRAEEAERELSLG